jgi:beta-galactosidase/beta-glucuronidase
MTVLWYRSLLSKKGHHVRGVLVAEHEPRDPSWRSLCDELGVLLIAAPKFDAIFD